MNKSEFIEFIKPYGWTVQPSWNGLNDRLVTPCGVATDIRVEHERLSPFTNHLFGGVSFEAFVYWYYADIKHNKEEKFISVDGLILMYGTNIE